MTDDSRNFLSPERHAAIRARLERGFVANAHMPLYADARDLLAAYDQITLERDKLKTENAVIHDFAAQWRDEKIAAEAALVVLTQREQKTILKLRAASGQLRHAYWLLQNTQIDSQHTFAEGLISPQIRRVEECADDLAQALAGDGDTTT